MRSLSRLGLCYFIAFVAADEAISPVKYELMPYDPVADPSAVVVSPDGKARFTVLSPEIIRMEYTETAHSFEDRPSIAFVNRKQPVPSFHASPLGSNGVSLNTSAVSLTYTGGNFSADSIQVVSTDSSSAFQKWNGGMQSSTDPGNLLGTFRTLDGTGSVSLNCTENKKVQCEFGLISRSGWALVVDSFDPVWDGDDWWADPSGSVYERNSTVDWYLFAHGHDYKGALKAYTQIGGHIPVYPRAMSGVMWSRWYNMDARDVLDLINDYESRGLPLDVHILDMNWHLKNDWTGYSWDPRLIPNATDLMQYVTEERKLMQFVNLHDADGIAAWETQYEAMCECTKSDCSQGATIKADFSSKTYVRCLEDVVMKPLYDIGVHGWIDWQQSPSQVHLNSGKFNPTILTDWQRVTSPKRQGSDKRGAVLARFGGLGTHRYQAGFSGDVAGLTWDNLAFQPYFSSRATNVGYGSWSHDLVGPSGDHEMYTRWTYFIFHSGAARSHDRGMSAGGCKDPFPAFDADDERCDLVRLWNVPHYYFEANRDAMQWRARHVPYIYTAMREGFDEGLGLVRSMYLYAPEAEMAYAGTHTGDFAQFFLGPDLIVAPVVTPSGNDSLAPSTHWLPEGTWYSDLDHSVIKVTNASGSIVNGKYDATEVPRYWRAGAVVPSRPVRVGDSIAVAQRQYDELEFTVVPGAATGSGRVYEDDGSTVSYVTKGAFAFTSCSYSKSSDGATVKISTNGSYPELPSMRTYTVRLPNFGPPSAVSVSGGASGSIPFSRWGRLASPNRPPTTSYWSFDGEAMATEIVVVGVHTADGLVLQISGAPGAPTEADFDGVGGIARRARLAKHALDEVRQTVGAHHTGDDYIEDITRTPQMLGLAAGRDVASFAAMVKNVSATLPFAIEQIKNSYGPPPQMPPSIVSFYDQGRKDQLACGSEGCYLSNTNYDMMRIEGYYPAKGAEDAVPMSDWWNQDISDNWVDTLSSAPSGYTPATFSNGLVLSKQVEGTVPLYCYFSQKDGDHATVAAAESIAWAKENGYSPCTEHPDGVIGYVYTKPSQWQGPVPRVGALGGLDADRFDYVLGLMSAPGIYKESMGKSLR